MNTTRKIRALAASVIMIVVLGLAAQSASAATTTGNGSPGTATIPQTTGRYVGYAQGGTIETGARTVYESPGYRNYDQYVCLTARLWKLNNHNPGQSWSRQNQRSECAWIPAAQSAVNIRGTLFPLLTGPWAVDIAITWQLSNGTRVGSRNYDYDATSDYRCLTGLPACRVDRSTIGAFVSFL